MKKKLIAVCLIIAMMAITVVGGTMAYFFDTAENTNVFTVGNVQIELEEVQKKPEGGFDEYPDKEAIDAGEATAPQLMPGDGDTNNVSKIAWIKNTSETNKAWVWAEIWIPAELDDTNAAENSLHFNYYGWFTEGAYNNTKYFQAPVDDGIMDASGKIIDSNMVSDIANNLWTWADGDPEFKQDEDQFGNTIDYHVYTVMMKNPLEPGKTSLPFLRQVYMDSEVVKCDGTDDECTVKDTSCTAYILKSGKHYAADQSWELIVKAYAMQYEGFEEDNGGIEAAMEAFDNAQKK